MYNPDNNEKLIVVDIARAMTDYVGIQPDIDPRKVQAASLIVQTIDLKKLIGQTNVERCRESVQVDASDADKDLREMLIPVIAFYTMARLLKLFPGTFTDSGYVIEDGASDKDVTARQANEFSVIGDQMMEDVFEFLKEENPQSQAVIDGQQQVTRGIRVFGGREHRESYQSPNPNGDRRR